jgi:hypothetical protein
MSAVDPYAGMNAVATMAIAGVSLIGAFYLAFRTWRDGEEIRNLRKELEDVKRRTDRSYLNGREIETVVRDLYKRIEKTIVLIHAAKLDPASVDGQAERLRKQKIICDKHFQELQLFSRDEQIRNVALKQITYGVGDWYSLDRLRACIEVFDNEDRQLFVKHSRILEERLRSTVVTDSSSWTGR